MPDSFQQEAFLLLLRQGLWNNQEDSSKLFPLSPGDWSAIYNMAVKQTVQGIVYDGIMQLPAEHRPPRQLLIKWTVVIDSLERINRQHQAAQNILAKIFETEPDIKYQILKGQSIAKFYPNPLHRLCGDIDLYFGNEEQTEKANKRIEEKGIPVQRANGGEASYTINGVYIEHHSHLLDIHNPLLKKTSKKWEQEKFQSTNQLPIATHLLLSTHILKHWIDLGIGIRQLCDAAITLKALHDSTDKKELYYTCRQFNVLKWSKLLYSLLNKHLGLQDKYLPFPCKANPDAMMREILESGNFGHGDTRYGNRPQGKWKSKWHTWKIVYNKLHISLRYATSETIWWLTLLIYARLKEYFK